MESPHKLPRYFTPVRMKKQDSQFSNFRRFIDQLVFTEINNESDLLLALSAKFGTDFTSIAIQAILKHVPAKFPNRWIYVSNIVKVINATCTDVQLNLILKHINTIVNVDIHTGAVPEETLWDATYLSKRTHMAFLVTKVDTCMVKGCGGNLFGSLKDTTDVTVFTLTGPVPYLKATLKCKNCCTRYGIDKYHIAHGKSYMYPDRFKPDVIMASSKVFFSLDTFEMLCESGNHAFVSAQGFAEIYNSTFHAEHPVVKSYVRLNEISNAPTLSPIVILSPLTITCLPPRHVGEDETEESVHIPMASTPLPSPRHIPPVQTNTDRSTELIPATTPLPSPIPAAPFNSDPSPVILPVPRKSQRGKGTVSKTKARWCTCKKTLKWKMIGCDGEQCDIEWFHVKCVGLTKIPKGEWFCEPCKARL